MWRMHNGEFWGLFFVSFLKNKNIPSCSVQLAGRAPRSGTFPCSCNHCENTKLCFLIQGVELCKKNIPTNAESRNGAVSTVKSFHPVAFRLKVNDF